VRLAVDPAAVAFRGLRGAGGRSTRQWIPRHGDVTWPDGRPAGHYKGTTRYVEDQIEDRGDRICVDVGPVAERVCHARENIKIEDG
jgi:hypothetical protein